MGETPTRMMPGWSSGWKSGSHGVAIAGWARASRSREAVARHSASLAAVREMDGWAPEQATPVLP
ncbi:MULTISPECIES: hypothetical protein [unclassified Streptosporangium]|uniref:hypothetical protein n=1 Tax=Streptosporangium sp. NPDC005286 TaxID=3154463 RepID=UPI0033AA6575